MYFIIRTNCCPGYRPDELEEKRRQIQDRGICRCRRGGKLEHERQRELRVFLCVGVDGRIQMRAYLFGSPEC